MKKILLIIFSLVIMISFIGCKDKSISDSEKNEKKSILTENRLGLDIKKPSIWGENNEKIGVMVGEQNQIADKKKTYLLDSYGMVDISADLNGKYKNLLYIEVIKKSQWDKMKEKGYTFEDFIREPEKEDREIIEKNDLVYVISCLKKDELSEDTELDKLHKSLYLPINEVKELVNFIKVNPAVSKDLPEAETAFDGLVDMPQIQSKDIDGNEITNEIFKDKKLTMINIWTTWCGPCVGELPEIQKLYEEMKKENINVVGVIVDGNEEKETALKILKETGVKYTSIIPSEAFKKNFLDRVIAYPTTIFVNSNGEIFGETICGSRDMEKYKEIIEKIIKE